MQWTCRGPFIIDSTQNRENLAFLVRKMSELTKPNDSTLGCTYTSKIKKFLKVCRPKSVDVCI